MVKEGIRVCPWDLADFGPDVVLFDVGGRFIKTTEELDIIAGSDCPAEELGEELLDGGLAVSRELEMEYV